MTKITNTGQIIKLNQKEFKIEKAPLKIIIKTLENINAIPKELTEVGQKTKNYEFLNMLPKIISQSLIASTKALKIIANNNELTENDLLESSAVENLELVLKILEINEVERIIELIKKIKGVGGIQMVKMATKM